MVDAILKKLACGVRIPQLSVPKSSLMDTQWSTIYETASNNLNTEGYLELSPDLTQILGIGSVGAGIVMLDRKIRLRNSWQLVGLYLFSNPLLLFPCFLHDRLAFRASLPPFPPFPPSLFLSLSFSPMPI